VTSAYAEHFQLKKLLVYLASGDVVVVPEVDRPSQNTPHATMVAVVGNRER
jgi:DNA invertase Pin-like site-specific DNA recombinase